MNSIDFIKGNVPVYSIILSLDYIGGLLPAFVSVRSYFGHPTLTINYLDKMAQVNKFYGGSMEKGEARSFLVTQGIDYIYIGPVERGNIGNIKNYNLPVQEIYDNGQVLIYKVN